MSETFNDYVKTGPLLSQRLFVLLKKMPTKTLMDVAKEAGVNVYTINSLLRNPEKRRSFIVLRKVENYLDRMEKEIR